MDSKSLAEKNFWKLLSNSLYGKILYNPRKNSTITRLVTNQKWFNEVATDPMLKDCYEISPYKLLMRFSPQNISLKYSLLIGWFVLEESKRFMYDLY